MKSNINEPREELNKFLYEYKNSDSEFEEIKDAVLGAYGRIYEGKAVQNEVSPEGELISISGTFFTKRYLYSKMLYKCGYIKLSEMLMNDPQRIVDRNNTNEKMIFKLKPQKK